MDGGRGVHDAEGLGQGAAIPRCLFGNKATGSVAENVKRQTLMFVCIASIRYYDLLRLKFYTTSSFP